MREIDADALLQNLRGLRDVHGEVALPLDAVANLVNCMPTLTPPNEWVSVEERQLEPGQRVIATDGDFVGEAYVTESGLWVRFAALLWETAFNSPVTHWMPLPAPPEGEEAVP